MRSVAPDFFGRNAKTWIYLGLQNYEGTFVGGSPSFFHGASPSEATKRSLFQDTALPQRRKKKERQKVKERFVVFFSRAVVCHRAQCMPRKMRPRGRRPKPIRSRPPHVPFAWDGGLVDLRRQRRDMVWRCMFLVLLQHVVTNKFEKTFRQRHYGHESYKKKKRGQRFRHD